MFAVTDVVSHITNNLDIKSVINFMLTCKESASIFNWSTYFLSNVKNTYKYNDIDINFMRLHGQYLTNITNNKIVKQWFNFYKSFNIIGIIFERFKNKSCIKFTSTDRRMDLKDSLILDINFNSSVGPCFIVCNNAFNIIIVNKYGTQKDYDFSVNIVDQIMDIMLKIEVDAITVSIDYIQIYSKT
jgi:hypothetical protein